MQIASIWIFDLDRPRDFFRLSHTSYGYGANDKFLIFGIASAAFRGFGGYVSKLGFDQEISMGNFIQQHGSIVRNGQPFQWNPGEGFIGFRFSSGAGVQYGWARIEMSGVPHYDFVLLDYASASPGERLRAGQTLEDTVTPTPTPRPRPTPHPRPSAEQAPTQGSLGWLALGAVGLLAWRKSRKSLTARLEDA